ncbi:MAG: heavy metal-responsive transcriptional regulator [Pseudonocardiales bacterium]|nr:MAG: heavy metal-responsive transcriptional regulator [Pseudonocardiales bacterium]
MAETAMRIGELAQLAGISTSALRYYEETGLLGPAARTEAGYRIYREEAVGRLQFVQRAKALGLSLEEIRQLLTSPEADVGTERDRLRHLVAHKLAETRARIAELQALDQELESLYVRLLRVPGPDCGHLGDCGCWLPSDEEVKAMAKEVACCGQLCCPNCACSQGQSCDCPDCPCNQA